MENTELTPSLSDINSNKSDQFSSKPSSPKDPLIVKTSGYIPTNSSHPASIQASTTTGTIAYEDLYCKLCGRVKISYTKLGYGVTTISAFLPEILTILIEHFGYNDFEWPKDAITMVVSSTVTLIIGYTTVYLFDKQIKSKASKNTNIYTPSHQLRATYDNVNKKNRQSFHNIGLSDLGLEHEQKANDKDDRDKKIELLEKRLESMDKKYNKLLRMFSDKNNPEDISSSKS